MENAGDRRKETKMTVGRKQRECCKVDSRIVRVISMLVYAPALPVLHATDLEIEDTAVAAECCQSMTCAGAVR